MNSVRWEQMCPLCIAGTDTVIRIMFPDMMCTILFVSFLCGGKFSNTVLCKIVRPVNTLLPKRFKLAFANYFPSLVVSFLHFGKSPNPRRLVTVNNDRHPVLNVNLRF